jgi:hypothetical protein
MSEFIKQVTGVTVEVITKPRVFIKWNNTERGRDANDCYERVEDYGRIIYINTHNRNSFIPESEPFFDTLEELYNKHK